MDVFHLPDADIHSGRWNNLLETTRLSLYPEEGIACRLKHYLKFIFVRHPLDRLLSAYRSKFFTNTTQNALQFFKPYGRTIIRQYRRQPSFASLIFGNDVRFEEFLRFVFNQPVDLMDRHWMPYSEQCFPCELSYDIIGTHETMTEDANYLLDSWNITNLRFPPPYRSVAEEACEYEHFYKNVSPLLIKDLIEKYKIDSLMFGYSDYPELRSSNTLYCNNRT